MIVEAVSNASFLITLSNGKKILTDPWYTDGIYYGSWANFPPLSDSDKHRYLTIEPDYIYISHIHPDHLDSRTLSQFDLDTPILIGNYPTPELEFNIRRLGFHDIHQLDFDTIVQIDDIAVSILKQFEGSGDGYISDVEYLMDSSLWVKDVDGQTLLNINDNPIKEKDADRIVKQYGRPDCAILPYGGASPFPHAFPQYDADEKARRCDAVGKSRLNHFIDIATIIGARSTIPAAGSYVMSGRIAHYSQYLHQAVPEQVSAAWTHSDLPGRGHDLCFMMVGDTLDTGTGQIVENPQAQLRGFDHKQRLEYALTLEGRPLPQDEIYIPNDFLVPILPLLKRARKNLWAVQVKEKCFPKEDIELVVTSSDGIPTIQTEKVFHFTFPLDDDSSYEGVRVENDERKITKFYLDSSLLLMILIKAANWNNVEIGALVEIERHPDQHDPTIHTIMNYFTL